MRALALLTLVLAGCSFAVDTDNLAGGAARVTDGGVDSASCDRESCVDEAIVAKLADLAPCTAETSDKLGCRAKIIAACKAANPCCNKGGYGPVAFPNASEATVLCLVENTYEAPVSEILAAAPGCTSSTLTSRACDNAVHVSATKRGEGTGVLQSVAGETATIVGIDIVDEVSDVTWAELTALDPGCTMATAETQACTNAVQRYCTTGDFEDYVGGIGPLRWTTSSVTLVCL